MKKKIEGWPLTAEQKERFWSKVDQSAGDDGCWHWERYTVGVGYGLTTVFIDGKRYTANRLAWAIGNNRPVPDGMYVLHHCDNPSCCNPAHLYLGTQSENMRDMYRRNRGPRRKGEASPTSKLSRIAVIEIRKRYAAGESAKQIAAEFGVAAGTVGGVARGKRWQHVGGPRTHRGVLRGEEGPSAKLTEKDVREIREKYQRGNVSRQDLAEEYGISPSNVGAIVNRKTWKHLDNEDKAGGAS